MRRSGRTLGGFTDNRLLNTDGDAETEAAETQTWLQFADRCGCLPAAVAAEMIAEYNEIIAMLVSMITHRAKWIL